MKKLLWVIILALSLAAGPATAVGLVYKPPPSSGLRYQQTCDISLQASTTAGAGEAIDNRQQQTSLYWETASEADADGSMSLVRRIESGRGTPQPAATLATPPESYNLPRIQSFLRLTGRGRVLSVQTFLDPVGETSPPPPKAFDLNYMALDLATLEALLTHIPFPEGPVATDQVWSEKFRLPNFLGASITPVTFTSRLLAFDNYQGKESAKVRTAFEIPFAWQYPQMLDRLRVPLESRDNLTTQGRIIGRFEWWFDIKRGCLLSAEGPMEISAKTDYYFFDQNHHSVNSSLLMTMKRDYKIDLEDFSPSSPTIKAD